MRVVVPVLAAALLLAGCAAPSGEQPSGSSAPSPSTTGDGPGSAIPQPRVPRGVPVAPTRERVDLTVPTFSDPTRITNPWFPVSRQASVVFVGHVDGRPFRTEVTLLPRTRPVDWGGQRVETAVSQYTAYLGGRLQEVAYDLYAQADDGSVWYFGEDVADLEHGVIATKEGTWLAGKDGPAQMIMPGDPQVGDVYRTENIPGIAFEEVTIRSVSRQLPGPFEPVAGMVGQELHEDGTTELKQFGSGYGEYYTGDGKDVEALALAVPTDAAGSALPPPLPRLEAGAVTILRSGARPGDPARLQRLWRAVPDSAVPRLMRPVVERALAGVGQARTTGQERQAAMDLALRVLDLELRYREVAGVDQDRVGLWCDQLRLDAARGDRAGVSGDVFTLGYLRDRVQASLPSATATAYDIALGSMQEAVLDGDLARASRAASTLGAAIGRGAG